jgi:hypothetical protein
MTCPDKHISLADRSFQGKEGVSSDRTFGCEP